MSKQELTALIASAITLVIGLAAAITLHEGHWFARSGSIVAIVSILFASLEIRKRLADAGGIVDAVLLKQRSETMRMCSEKNLDMETSLDLVERIDSEARAKIDEQIKSASKRVLRVELGLLLVGTFIWGFGDLPLDRWFESRANNGVQATCEDARA